MKGSALLFLAILIIICSFQRKKPGITPPGTIRINDTLFVDETEVANIHWREYLYYLEGIKKDSSAYVAALPDTAVWRMDTAWNEPVSEYYFRHPGFNNYPVTGISYEQAVAFCKWRTFAANFTVYTRKNKIKNAMEHLDDPFPIKFTYRLPTKAEWEMIAAGKLNDRFAYPYGYPAIYFKWKRKTSKAFNCDYSALEGKKDTTCSFYTAEVKSYYPNSSGAYCMIGNLAEMVAEKGIAKGGSFLHPLDSCRIATDQHYSQPGRWLGFRCVAVMKP